LSTEEGFEETKTEEKGYAMHPGTPVDVSKVKWQQPASFHVQSPLQHVENVLLDAAESAVDARKTSVTKSGSRKLSVDTRAIEEDHADEEEHNMHGSPIALSKMKWQQSTPAHVHAPSSGIVDRPLTGIEAQLEAHVLAMNKFEAERLKLDVEVAVMKESHEQFKKSFSAMYLHGTGKEEEKVADDPVCACPDHGRHPVGEDADEDDEDLISLRSSIDLDEEPTVHVAKIVTFTRITPGMMKLVDIPPRKKKPAQSAQKVVAPVKKEDGYVKDWVAA
jgi:hypothetical protein